MRRIFEATTCVTTGVLSGLFPNFLISWSEGKCPDDLLTGVGIGLLFWVCLSVYFIKTVGKK